MFRWRNQSGQSLPMIALTLFLILALIVTSVTFGGMVMRRTDVQAAADAAALAGANALAKMQMTVAFFEAIQFVRNLVMDVMYITGVFLLIACPVPCGPVGAWLVAKAKAFGVATAKAMAVIDNLINFANAAGPIYASYNAWSYSAANGYFGFGIPLPIHLELPRAPTGSDPEGGEFEPIEEELETADKELEELMAECDGKEQEYHTAEAEALQDLLDLQEKEQDYQDAVRRAIREECLPVNECPYVIRAELERALAAVQYAQSAQEAQLKKQAFDECQQREAKAIKELEERRDELDRQKEEMAERESEKREEQARDMLERIPKLSGGEEGILVAVFDHDEDPIPFSDVLLGGLSFPSHMAVAGAYAQESDHFHIAQDMFEGTKGLGKIGAFIIDLISSIAMKFYEAREGLADVVADWLGEDLGSEVMNMFNRVLGIFGLEPPDVRQRRPVLRSTRIIFKEALLQPIGDWLDLIAEVQQKLEDLRRLARDPKHLWKLELPDDWVPELNPF